MSALQMVITTAAFFADQRKLAIEAKPNTGRTYFLDRKGRIVAVAAPADMSTENDAKRTGLFTRTERV